MNRRTRLAAMLFAASLGTLLFAASASASFHLVKIKEVFLGAAGNDAFVELQMPAAGENEVTGQKVAFYTANGNLLTISDPFPSKAPSGQNQRTILIGDSAVPDRDFAYDALTGATLSYGPGGAACYTGSNDCVAWGNFADANDTNEYTGNAGTPVLPAGIPTGSSITRKINRGCPTTLDLVDDTNNSAADFVQTTPPPRRATPRPPAARPASPVVASSRRSPAPTARTLSSGPRAET